MDLRHILHEKPGVAIVIIVAAFATSIWMATGSRSTANTPPHAWFYNMETGELEALTIDKRPPVKLPSGAEGVGAFLYACGNCANESERFGYLFTSQAGTVSAETSDMPGSGPPTEYISMIVEPDKIQWHREGSAAAMRIVRGLRERCDTNQQLVPCNPPDPAE